MAMLAEPWPSQRRGQQSDRHAALERMKARRGNAHSDSNFDDEEPPARPRPPPGPRSDAARPQNAAVSQAPRGPRESSSRPSSSRGSGPETPRRSTPRRADPTRDSDEQRRSMEKRSGKCRSDDPFMEESPSPTKHRSHRDRAHEASGPETPRSSRVRGPAEARHARGEPQTLQAEEALPAAAKGADFATLQSLIAKGIAEAETGASVLEKDVVLDQSEIKRLAEARSKRLEDDERRRQEERVEARKRRQQEDDERRARQQEELDREEREEQTRRDELSREKARCSQEYHAASRIQSRFRGRRSRNGIPIHSPFVTGKTHSKPLSPLSTPDLLD